MDSATTTEIPLPSEYPGRADPSPASRDPLNSLLCAILDPYRTIEEIAEDRRITVMTLGEILSAEPASSTIESLRKVFALRAEMLALHARASAVGTLTRIANSDKDDEVARRAATTLLRMFRPDGTPSGGGHHPDRAHANRAPLHAPTEPRPSGSGPRPTPPSRGDRAPDRGSERSGFSSQPASSHGSSTPTISESASEIAEPSHPLPPSITTPLSAAPTPPTARSERGGPEGRPSPSGSARQPQQQPHRINHRLPEVKAASPSGSAHPPPVLHDRHHHRRVRHDDGVEEDARPPPCLIPS